MTTPLALPQSQDLPQLRLVPAPDGTPPYDCRGDRSTRLRLVPGAPTPTDRRLRPAPEPGPVARPTPLPLPPDQRTRTSTAALPACYPVARALVQRLLETAAGARPVRQLQADTSPEIFQSLLGRLSGRPPAARRPSFSDVRSVHVQERPDGVVEVCATVQRHNGRTRRLGALALRLEGEHGRWVCTELVGL